MLRIGVHWFPRWMTTPALFVWRNDPSHCIPLAWWEVTEFIRVILFLDLTLALYGLFLVSPPTAVPLWLSPSKKSWSWVVSVSQLGFVSMMVVSYSRRFAFPYEFKISLSTSIKMCAWIFSWDPRNSLVQVGGNWHLNRTQRPRQQAWPPFCLHTSPLASLTSALPWPVHGFHTGFIRSVHK